MFKQKFNIIYVPVDMKIERSGPRLITGFHGFVFTLEAKTNEPEKDVTKTINYEKKLIFCSAYGFIRILQGRGK